jgi:GT2 family glycosyltransferase
MTTTSLPSIAVVVATRGRPENLSELTGAVLDDDNVSVMVVVVDGEDHESLAVLQELEIGFPRLIHRQIPRSGHLKALATGVSMTDAEVVVFLDDDVFPAPGLATAHAQRHIGESHLVVVGAMPVELPEGRADVGSILYARDYLAHCARIEAGEQDVLHHLWMGNVSIRRADCLAVGMYSAAFTASYHTDQDLGFRLAEAGLIGRYDPDLRAVHRHRRDGKTFLNDARRRGAGVADLHGVHPELGPADPSAFTADLPRPLAAIVRGLGRVRIGPPAALVLLGLAHALGRVGWAAGRVMLAQLARRIMLVRGLVAGERVATQTVLEPVVTEAPLAGFPPVRWPRPVPTGAALQSDVVPV